jgi:hypothetical protein
MITNVLLGYNFISCEGEIQLKCETITYNDKYNVMNTGKQKPSVVFSELK